MPRSTTIQKRFGERILQLRNERGWSQENAAVRCKVSRTYLSQLEAGQRNPSLTTLDKIAKAFKLPLSELVPSD